MPPIADDDTHRNVRRWAKCISDLPKKWWAQTWTALKKAQDKIKTGWIWCQIVSHGENAKKVPSYRLIREKFLKLLTPSIKVDNFPRKSTQMWRWDFDDMVPSKLKGLPCSIRKLNLNMRWKILFSRIKCLVYNKITKSSHPNTTKHLSVYTSAFSK